MISVTVKIPCKDSADLSESGEAAEEGKEPAVTVDPAFVSPEPEGCRLVSDLLAAFSAQVCFETSTASEISDGVPPELVLPAVLPL